MLKVLQTRSVSSKNAARSPSYPAVPAESEPQLVRVFAESRVSVKPAMISAKATISMRQMAVLGPVKANSVGVGADGVGAGGSVATMDGAQTPSSGQITVGAVVGVVEGGTVVLVDTVVDVVLVVVVLVVLGGTGQLSALHGAERSSDPPCPLFQVRKIRAEPPGVLGTPRLNSMSSAFSPGLRPTTVLVSPSTVMSTFIALVSRFLNVT